MAASDLQLKVLLELRDKAAGPLGHIARQNEKLVAGLTATQETLTRLAGQRQAMRRVGHWCAAH